MSAQMRERVVMGVSGGRVCGSLARCLAACVVVCGVWLTLAVSALAVGASPGWSIHSQAIPTRFSTQDNAVCSGTLGGQYQLCDGYQMTVRNVGSVATAEGAEVSVGETLPAGLTLGRVRLRWPEVEALLGGVSEEQLFPTLEMDGFCTKVPLRCSVPVSVAPGESIEMNVFVTVDEPVVAGSLVNRASVSGGGAGEASTSTVNPLGGVLPGFGGSLAALVTGLDGQRDARAGDHPYEFSTRFDLNTKMGVSPEGSYRPTGIEDPRDIVVDLPLGFIGSALAAPTCTFAQLSSRISGGVAGCPTDTVIGHIHSDPGGTSGVNGPLYNVAPERGVPAEFGYADVLGGAHLLYASVAPSARGYVLRTTAPEIPQIPLTDAVATIYGDPSAKDASGTTPVALFTNPAVCSGASLSTVVHMDSWQHPGAFNADGTPDLNSPGWVGMEDASFPEGLTGCNLLQFVPALSVAPETAVPGAADSPAGLNVNVKVPQFEEPSTLATPPLRDATVTLPAGLTINPAAADGLAACSEAQIALASAAAPACPESSKVGSVELTTPLVAGTLTGSLYLAAQNENPFHALFAAYIVVDDPATGVVIKVPGRLTLDPSTGQVSGSFEESPQFPFSELKLHFDGGARGKLATPMDCGTYTTTSDWMPWSAPDSGLDATPSASFPINTGCVTGFAPSLTAGSTNTQAGGFSPFVLSLSRSDGDQNLAGLSVTLPPGLLGKIAGIPLCPDANANAGTCPEASRVGSVQAGAGVGPDPFFLGGKVYLTGPYNGGPYGLVVQVPAVAGPFDLGVVSVRQSLRIDSHTAQVTAVSDPFPTILDGVPLRIRRVDVTLDRPGFTFNPTNCTPMAITGTVTSIQGASANVSSRFQAGGCRELGFKPSFTVSTQAHTSKRNGASLDVKVVYPQGAQANIRSTAVTLPKALPSRLSTIQQACPEATFNENPASCPAGSDIGVATVHTPVLAGPISGPAYLVSHGGAAFPDIVLVLQGEGVKLELTGSVSIKKQVTSSAFNTVPDAPVSSFELRLPEGPHSGLTAVLPPKAKGNLCGTTLTMPTTITGQNGAQIKQNTKIQVTGCPKTKKKKPKTKKHHKTKKK
jgi:hypothetical protein